MRKTKKSNNRLVNGFIIVMCALIVVSSTANAYSWGNPLKKVKAGVTSALKRFSGNLIGDTVSSLANEMMEGLGSLLSGSAMGMGDSLVKAMVNGFGPDTNAFIIVLGGGDLQDGVGAAQKNKILSESGGLPDSISYFNEVAQIFGYVIAMVVFLFALVNYFWTEPTNVRETPLRLILRLALAFVLIKGGSSSIVPFMDVGNTIWTDYVMSSPVAGSGASEKLEFKNLLVGDVNDEASTKDELVATVMGVNVVCTELAIFLFMPIVIILISWPLIKGFFKMYIEIVERYLVVMLLYFFFAAAAGTVVSKQSSTVLKSYMKMFASQILILFMNVGFMSIFVEVLGKGAWTCSLPNYIFALAFIRIVQRVDSYMSSLGLNVAQTGGQTLDTLGGVARGMVNSVRNSSRTAGNALRQGAGQTISASMLNKGNGVGAVVANALAAPGGVVGMASDAAKTVASGGVIQRALSEAADKGAKISVPTNDAASTMRKMLNNPSNFENAKRVGAIDNQSMVNGLNKILSDNNIPMRATGIDERQLKAGQIGFMAQPIDKAGNLIKNAPQISGTLSSSESMRGDSVNISKSGESMFLNTSNSMKEHPGKKYHENAQTLGLMSGTSKAISGAGEGFRNQITAMQYNSANGGSYALYNNKGKEGQQIGLISNINGTQMLSQSVSEGATGDKESFKNYITDQGNKAAIEAANGFMPGSLSFSDNQINPGGKAIGHAEIEDEFGSIKQMDVHIRDMGAQGYNGGNILTMNGLDGAMHNFAVKTRETRNIETEASKPPKRLNA